MSVTALLMVACASGKSGQTALFDLGPALSRPAVKQQALPPIALADADAPAWLDSPAMFYRLAYSNAQQPRPYATSRWAMPPPMLFAQRLKLGIAEAGGMVLSRVDGVTNVVTLHLDLDDFTQTFTAPDRSHVQVAVRASLLNGRTLVAQRTFVRREPAGADAASGAAALATASDAVIADMVAWLVTATANRQ